MFLLCPSLRFSKRISPVILTLSLGSILQGQTSPATIRWGTHEGVDSPLWQGTNTNPTSAQLASSQLMDIAGTGLSDSSGGPESGTWTKGALVELGFFASALGTSGNIGGTGGEADTPSTNLFEGTWIPLTTKTFVGQDWGTRDTSSAGDFEVKQKVDEGEIAFSSKFEFSAGAWPDYVNHNQDADSPYRILYSDSDAADRDVQSILSDHLTAIENARSNGDSVKLGMRFYDVQDLSSNDGVARYNTIMNTNWAWPESSLEMYLHNSDGSLDSANLKFEFDNSDYASVSKAGSGGVNAQNSDFVTTITYWTGGLDLDISGSNKNTVISGVDSSANILGGGNNELTLNVNGEGTTSNAFTHTGNIIDSQSGGYLELIKTGSGKQTITGNLDMVSDVGSVLNVNDGTLTLATASGKTHSVEYLKGAGGTLELADGDSDLITLGFANTNGGDTVDDISFDYSDATFAGTVLLSGNVAHTVKVGSGTTAGYYEDEQTLSGSLSTSGTDTLVKDGVGRLRLTGDSSSNYDNLITVNDGTLVLGDAGNTNNVNFDTTGPEVTQFRVEKGKLEIAAGDTINNAVLGSGTSSNNTKSMVGGDGTLDTVTIGSADNEIDTISPGQGIASSLSSTNSQQQVSLGNGAASDSIGTFKVENLTLNTGGVYDWEIRDFDGSAGSDWDLLRYDSLTYNAAHTFNINVFSLGADGNGGASAGDTWSTNFDNSGAYGFKFMEWANAGTGSKWSGSNGLLSNWNVNVEGWQYYNHSLNDWGVYHHEGSFYLQYSAVPEPSTYMMVTGLLMLPGYNFVRRFRKKKEAQAKEEENPIT